MVTVWAMCTTSGVARTLAVDSVGLCVIEGHLMSVTYGGPR